MQNSKVKEQKYQNNSTEVEDFLECEKSFSGHGEGFVAEYFNSGFSLSHDTYNGISSASDGKIYYILCSISRDEGGKMYSFDPSKKEISLLGDLTEICGESNLKSVPQGKSHVPFMEYDGKLFFSTHVGYYELVDGMDMIGTPEGYQPYPGGHILSYDPETNKFTDYGIPVKNEGVLTMGMDLQRGIIYGITWPTGYFFRYDVKKREVKNFGTISRGGENGKGDQFRVLCRVIAINPNDGNAYFSVSEGDIYKCGLNSDKLELVGEGLLKKDYFGQYDPSAAGHMAYNWRQIFWHEAGQKFYGVHGNSGYLFSYDPVKNDVELLERLTSVPSRKSGMFDQFSYGYLGFALGKDNKTIFYLTGAPIYENGKRVLGKNKTGKGEAKGLEHLHLVTYDLNSGKYSDHGPVFFENGNYPTYVNSIAVGSDHSIYFLGRVSNEEINMTDLICIRNPLGN